MITEKKVNLSITMRDKIPLLNTMTKLSHMTLHLLLRLQLGSKLQITTTMQIFN